MSEVLLEVKNINVAYGKVQVLWDINLNIKKGECITLLGANGSGKTTLLKTIAGLVHPFNGEIYFKGERIDQLPPHEVAKIGIIYIPEGRRIFTKMTVKENLLVGSTLKKDKRKQLLKRVYEIFPVLKEKEKQIAGTLSGGEQQMLSIARGLMADPEVLLVDEISLGLAPLVIEQLYEKLREINWQGVSVLMVDEVPLRCLKFSQRSYVIRSGRIVFEGPSDYLLKSEKLKEIYFGV